MGNFLGEMLDFSSTLVPNDNPLPIFDLLQSEESDEDGTSLFKKQAVCTAYTLPRTRSQTKADQPDVEKNKSVNDLAKKLSLNRAEPLSKIKDMNRSKKPGLAIGDLVFAHKGQSVPCWFPGVLIKKGKRGQFKVNFFADFGEEDCAPNNIMPYDDYDRRKSEGKTTKFFGVPKKFEPNFEKALILAIEHNTAK